MGRLKNFDEFINEAEFKLNNPGGSGSELAKIIDQNKGALEVGGNNMGSDITKFQKSVGISQGQPWCMAFIYYIFDQFSKKMNITNPVYKTGSVRTEWEKTKGKKIDISQARGNFKLVKPGQIMIASRGGGGHAGIVTDVDYSGKKFTTVEGNVGVRGTKQGVGTYTRQISNPGILGFIDYFPNRTEEFDKNLVAGLKGKFSTVTSDVVGSTDKTEVETDTSTSGGKSGGFLGKIIQGAQALMTGDRLENTSAPDDETAMKILGSIKGK